MTGTGAAGAAGGGAGQAGKSCLGDLSGIGTGDFQISFSVTTTATGSIDLLNQRGICDYGDFWDIRLVSSAAGHILVEVDGGSSADHAELDSTVAINDGKSHTVVVQRLSEIVTILIDGDNAGSFMATASLGALPALAVATDVCDGTSSAAAPQGTVTAVCVTALPGDAGIVAQPTVPSVIHEQEGPYTGTWTWNGTSYDATWSNGATATITVQSFTPESVVLRRIDKASSTTTGLTAIYSGSFTSDGGADGGGNIMNGAVTWTWPGVAGYPTSGTWSASWM